MKGNLHVRCGAGERAERKARLYLSLLDTREREEQGLTGKFVADLVLQIMSYVAQTERENIRQRQKEGIAVAKARGTRFGRPEKDLPETFERLAMQWQKGEISGRGAAEQIGVSTKTFIKYARRRKGEEEKQIG